MQFKADAFPILQGKTNKTIAEDRKKEAEEDEPERTILEREKEVKETGREENVRGTGGPNANPAPKRRKMNEENDYSEERKASLEPINPNVG